MFSVLCPHLVAWLSQIRSLQEETVHYIRLELIGIVMSSLGNFLNVVMVMEHWNWMIYVTLLLQMISSILFDLLLVSAWGLELGTDGVAYSSIITSALVLLVSIVICWKKLKMDYDNVFRDGWNTQWFRQWSRVGTYSVIESTIRNIVYLIVIIKPMNLLEEQVICITVKIGISTAKQYITHLRTPSGLPTPSYGTGFYYQHCHWLRSFRKMQGIPTSH